MFGQNTGSPFGTAPSPSPFGASTGTTGAFGAPAAPSAFGTQPTSGFGTTGSSFGTSQAPAPAFGTGGGFGAPAPAPGTAFGTSSGSTFGSTSTGFGTSTATGTTFGAPSTNTSPFGAPSPATGGGLFGSSTAPAPAQGGFFGSGATSTTGGFGAPAPAPFGGFGAASSTNAPAFGAAPSASTFGAPSPAPATSLFGTPAPAPFGAPPTAPASSSIFGGTQTPAPTGNLFGSTTTPSPAGTGGGLFGTQAAGASGTRGTQYQVTTKSDGASQIHLNSISGMAQYENKSSEELRMEDYKQGNRGTASAPVGTSAPGSMSFGSAPSTATSSGFSGFSSNTATSFGVAPTPAPRVGGFTSAPAPLGTSLFASSSSSAPASSGGGFGATTGTAGPFGAAKPGGLFGSTQAPASTGLFGSAPGAPTTFGGLGAASMTPAPSLSSGLFGASQNPSTNAFGGPAQAATSGMFGNAAPSPAGIFGGPQTSAPAGTGSLFGGNAPATSGLFGSSATSTLFQTPASGGAGGSLFGGNPAAPSATSFGIQPSQSSFGNQAPVSGVTAPAAPPATYGITPQAPTASAPFTGVPSYLLPQNQQAAFAQQLKALENLQKEMEERKVWSLPPSPSVAGTSRAEDTTIRVSPYTAPLLTSAVSYRGPPMSSVNIRPRGFGGATLTNDKSSLSSHTTRSFGKSSLPLNPRTNSAFRSNQLVIRPDAHKRRPPFHMDLTELPLPPPPPPQTDQDSREEVLHLPATSPQLRNSRRSPPGAMPTPTAGVTSPPAETAAADEDTAPPPSARKPSPEETKESPAVRDEGYELYQEVISAKDLVPKLTKENFTVVPSIEEMSKMSEAELATVSGFTVSREGYGRVSWEGDVDVRGIDLDSVVCIDDEGGVAVYDAEEKNGTKPPRGKKLNRPAVISIHNVFPEEGPNADAEVKERFLERVKKRTSLIGAEFISFDTTSGVWTFRVHHFTRYGMPTKDEKETGLLKKTQHFESGERGGRSPEKNLADRKQVRFDDAEEISFAVLVNDTDMAGTDAEVLNAAADARTMFDSLSFEEVQNEATTQASAKERQEVTLFVDESNDDFDDAPTEPLPRVNFTLKTSNQFSITARLARKCGVSLPTSSGTDLGLRMGRSFRVGWRPDGSFLHLQSGESGSATVLQQSAPKFSEASEEAIALSLPDTHLKHSKMSMPPMLCCPLFSLSGNGTAVCTLQDLEDAMTDYEKSSGQLPSMNEQRLVLPRAFALISHLSREKALPSDCSALSEAGSSAVTADDAGLRQSRALEACRKWIVDACVQDVRHEVRTGLSKNDVHHAIFACLTGGDVEQATSIAVKHNHLELAAALTAGADGIPYLRDQEQQWHESGASAHIPKGLLRIYKLLGGDLSDEDKTYVRRAREGGRVELDWRRRLCILLSYGRNPERMSTLASYMDKYASDLDNRIVPYPSPRYAEAAAATQDGPMCLLYLILSLVKENQGGQRDLATVVAPSTHTPYANDFAGTFHVAALLAALGCCRPLSSFEEARIVESYAVQLLRLGAWEWAVYVMLCSLGGAPAEEMVWRQQRAKDIVIRHFHSQTDERLRRKREFLEKRLCIPSSWFEEALAYPCAHAGDVLSYIRHAVSFSPELALRAVEQLVIPNILFQEDDDVLQSMKLLELFISDETSLASAMWDFLHLAENMKALSDEDVNERRDVVDESLGLIASVEERLVSYKTKMDRLEEGTSGLRVFPNYRLVPWEVFLSEALAGAALMKLQLEVLQAGYSIYSGKGRLLTTSQLAFLVVKEGADGLAQPTSRSNESILRGLI